MDVNNILQRLMKHTEADHGDFSLLRRAEKEIHEFALKIDAIQKETNEQERKEHFSNITSSVYISRQLHRVNDLCPSHLPTAEERRHQLAAFSKRMKSVESDHQFITVSVFDDSRGRGRLNV